MTLAAPIRIIGKRVPHLLGAALLLAGCGMQGSAGSRVQFPTNNQNFGNGPGNFQVSENAFNPQAPQTPEYTNELKRCDQLRAFGDSITMPCGGVINEFANELTRECYRAFNQIYNYDCNGLENRLRNALNTCASDLSENFNYLPSSCQNSLRRFFK